MAKVDWEFHCKILGVNPDATKDEIKAAYRENAKLLHPDKHKNNTLAKEKFQQVQAAYEYLNDHSNRPKTSEQTNKQDEQRSQSYSNSPPQPETSSFKKTFNKIYTYLLIACIVWAFVSLAIKDKNAPLPSQNEQNSTKEWQKYQSNRHIWRKIADWEKEHVPMTLSQYKQECERGNYSSCFTVAHELRLKGKVSEISPFFRKLCAGGKAVGCYYEGKEEHNSGNFKRTVALYEKACSIDGFACNDLATLAWSKRDFTHWKLFAERACDAKNSDGCSNLRSFYESMDIVSQNYEKKCVLPPAPTKENSEECHWEASMFDLAKSTSNAHSLGAEARLKACKYGDLSTCEEIDAKRIAENKNRNDLLPAFEIANDNALEHCRRGFVKGNDSALSLRSYCSEVEPNSITDKLKMHSFFCGRGCLWSCTSAGQIERSIGEMKRLKLTQENEPKLVKALCAAHDLGMCDQLVVSLNSCIDCIKTAQGFIPQIETCKRLRKDPREYARKELIAYKNILQKLCEEGDENVCQEMAVPALQTAYASIPER